MTTPSFQMGTAESLIDKSLDDIIKERRKEMKKTKNDHAPNGGARTGNRRPAHRKNVRQLDSQNQNKAKPTQVEKSVGKGKASRSAKIAAKRGLQKTDQPAPMDVQKEIYRQQRSRISKKVTTGAGGANVTDSPRTQQIRRIRRKARVNVSSMVDGKAKTQKNNQGMRTGPPPKKAVDAARLAMSKAGYQAPKGMKMEIRFVEK